MKTPCTIQGITWVVLREGRVALEKCPKKAAVLGVGEWFIPGGKLERGETPAEALVREIGEEWPGVVVEEFDPLPIIEGSAIPPGPFGLFLMRPYLVIIRGDIPEISADGVPVRWFPVA